MLPPSDNELVNDARGLEGGSRLPECRRPFLDPAPTREKCFAKSESSHLPQVAPFHSHCALPVYSFNLKAKEINRPATRGLRLQSRAVTTFFRECNCEAKHGCLKNKSFRFQIRTASSFLNRHRHHHHHTALLPQPHEIRPLEPLRFLYPDGEAYIACTVPYTILTQ